jgi:hypothetical protein
MHARRQQAARYAVNGAAFCDARDVSRSHGRAPRFQRPRVSPPGAMGEADDA